MGFWSKKDDEQLDEQTEQKMEKLFKALNQETDSERKKQILEHIRQAQDTFKETKKKKYKWWFMK